jgi:hypothetical protein
MKSSTTSDFWRNYRALPPAARIAARKAYKLWQQNPRHGRFNFKRKEIIGARASGRAIALWDANMKEHFIGSGLARTMNMNGCFGICELHRQLQAVAKNSGRAESDE